MLSNQASSAALSTARTRKVKSCDGISSPEAKRVCKNDQTSPVEVISSSASLLFHPSGVASPVATLSLPPDLFDIDKGISQVEERFGGGLNVLSHRHGVDQALVEVEYTARESAFYFGGDEELYEMALELYNREQAVEINYSPPVCRVVSLPLEKSGNFLLSKSCLHCGRSFQTKEHATHCIAVYRSEKLSYYSCLGCVGCRLALTYGINRVAIETKYMANQPNNDKKLIAKETHAPGWLTCLSKSHHWREDCPMTSFTPSCAHLTCANCHCYVCNRPASECAEWKESHCHAIHGQHKWDLLQQENTPEDIDPACFDFLDFPKVFDPQKTEEQQARARNTQYKYEDDHAMMLALELYNRQLCKLQPEPEGALLSRAIKSSNTPAKNIYCWRPQRDRGIYSRSRIRGTHRTPCTQCGRSFNEQGQRVYFECSTSDYGLSRDKVCEGCMGRNLYARFGSRKATILHQLEEWRTRQAFRETHDSYNASNVYVSNYRRETDMEAPRRT